MSSTRIECLRADITTLDVDTIVNAANDRLSPGGGVCGAIHRAAGPGLAEACRAIGRCETGDAVITSGFDLRFAKYVIHAVGPVYDRTPRSAKLLASAYRAILRTCDETGVTSVAIPCLSTGIYGYPNEPAARTAVDTVRASLEARTTLERVLFCCFSDEDLAIYRDLLDGHTEITIAR